MGITNEERSKGTLELIHQLCLAYKDITYETPQMAADMQKGLIMQIGMMSGNTLDVNDRETAKVNINIEDKV